MGCRRVTWDPQDPPGHGLRGGGGGDGLREQGRQWRVPVRLHDTSGNHQARLQVGVIGIIITRQQAVVIGFQMFHSQGIFTTNSRQAQPSHISELPSIEDPH